MRRLLVLFIVGLLAISRAWAADCVKTGSTCLDATPCKTISGVQVCLSSIGESCWKYEDTYNCVSPQQVDDCQALRDRGCGQIGSKCIKTNSDGLCTMYEQTYQCQSTPPQTTTVSDCSVQTFCLDGKCYDTGYAPDSDFVKAVAGMEGVREAGTYLDPNSLTLFGGFSGSCTKGFFGLKNCCKTDGGGSSMSNSVLGSALWAVGSEGIRYGSTYVYDALYQMDSSSIMTQGLGAMLGLDGQATAIFEPSFSYYGLTFTYLDGSLFFDFNPYSFAIQIGLQILSELLSCEQEEQILGLKRGQNLCHFVGSYCSLEIPILGICLETTESDCCFNSRLARIINEQGRPQIGKGWGSAESPDCSGFTQAQFANLNFDQMNLSEFYGEIMANVHVPDANALSGKTQQVIQNKVQQFYGN
jgi:conjugal transfer mating pair stabilization protein TraN